MKIGVLGTGTVGVMTVCHFLKYHKDQNIKVYCVHNPNKKILGIGESSNIQLPKLLWESLNFNVNFDFDELDATIKYSVYYKNWRKHNFYSPIIPNEYAIHFNNFKLKEFAFKRCKEIYKDRFEEIHEDVYSVINGDENVKVNNHTFDYVIDCRGWPESYDDYYVSNSLPLNKCFVYQIKKPGDWNFTYHQATKNGWLFGIPLRTRQGWGYLFNDKITTDQNALLDLSKILKKQIKKSDINEFKFKAYSAKQFLNKRIIKNGNRAIFFEPLEALSGGMYDNINRAFWDYIFKKKSEKDVNNYLIDLSKRYENFLCYIYHGGSTFNSKFWKHAKEITTKHLKNNDVWKETINFNKINYYNCTQSYPLGYYSWQILDKQLGYNYFI